MENKNSNIAIKIKMLLVKHNMTQTECAKRAGLSLNMFSRLLLGKNDWTVKTATKIIKVLPELTPNDFFDDCSTE